MRERSIAFVALGALALLWVSSSDANARWGKRNLTKVQRLGKKRAKSHAKTARDKAVGATAVGAAARRCYQRYARWRQAAIRLDADIGYVFELPSRKPASQPEHVLSIRRDAIGFWRFVEWLAAEALRRRYRFVVGLSKRMWSVCRSIEAAANELTDRFRLATLLRGKTGRGERAGGRGNPSTWSAAQGCADKLQLRGRFS